VNPRPTAAGPSRRQWLLLVCLFLVSLPAVTLRIYSSDEIQYFAYLRSLAFDRDLSFENEYRYFYDRGIARSDGFHETFLERSTDTGRRINYGTIGCAILWSPFYAAGHVVARATGWPLDGFSKPYVAAVAYGSAIYGFLAIVLAIRCAARLGLDGFAGGVAVWLGTPLLFYMYVAPPFSHACSAFTVALFTYVWLRVRDNWRPAGLAALGGAAALMAMTREQDVFFMAAPAIDWLVARGAGRGARDAGRGARDAVTGVLAAAVCFIAAYSPQLIGYKVLNGHFGPHASVANKMKWHAPHVLEVLSSPEHGYFVWTPLAALAVVGLLYCVLPPEGGSTKNESAFRRNAVWLCLLLMFALQVYISGSVDSWTVAGGFGQRRFVASTTLLAIGLSRLRAIATGSASARRGRWVLRTATALAVYWNIALTAEFATGLMDRQRLEPAKNAYDAVVTLPRQAPELAYRYVFDRQSFYRANPVPR
jgi:hypothetical protein